MLTWLPGVRGAVSHAVSDTHAMLPFRSDKEIHMPWIADGLPDKPKWLRSCVRKSDARKQIREMRQEERVECWFGPHAQERLTQHHEDRALFKTAGFRFRRRIRAVMLTRVFTWLAAAAVTPTLAVQLSRLLSKDGTGSVAAAAIAFALLALIAWLKRTRTLVEQRRSGSRAFRR
jgi:hypothetical protein